MQDRQESGLNIKSYCSTRGIAPNNYYYWQRKLREAENEQNMLREAELASTQSTPVGFSEVKLVSKGRYPEEASRGSIQIEASGARIAADKDYPIASLVTLLKELVKR